MRSWLLVQLLDGFAQLAVAVVPSRTFERLGRVRALSLCMHEQKGCALCLHTLQRHLYRAADVLTRCAQAVLELEQQPPDEALVKAAEAASATPNAAAYKQHQAQRAGAAGAKRERGDSGRGDRRSGREDRADRKTSGDGRREQDAPRFPRSDDPAVQHKLRLLRSAPYTELRAGDWFCGECGAHNYSFKQQCFR
jgi:hypothetical protein